MHPSCSWNKLWSSRLPSAQLASGLLASLDDSVADGSLVEQLWSEETARRASQIAATSVNLASWDQVVERVNGLRSSSAE